MDEYYKYDYFSWISCPLWIKGQCESVMTFALSSTESIADFLLLEGVNVLDVLVDILVSCLWCFRPNDCDEDVMIKLQSVFGGHWGKMWKKYLFKEKKQCFFTNCSLKCGFLYYSFEFFPFLAGSNPLKALNLDIFMLFYTLLLFLLYRIYSFFLIVLSKLFYPRKSSMTSLFVAEAKLT